MSIVFPFSHLNTPNAATTYHALFPEIGTVTLIGAGNVAAWLAFALKKANISISQIYSRSLKKSEKIAETCGAMAIDDLRKLREGSDLYLFSLKDDAYEEVVKEIPMQLPFALLTSGTVSQRVLAPIAQRFGILYPCQTLSVGMDFSQVQVPICVEGADSQTEEQIFRLAGQLTDSVVRMDEAARQQLHLAAVFACNFSNALYGIAFDILKNANIDPRILLPLLQNTLNKLQTLSPKEAQTGPAVRGDQSVMDRHLALLDDEQKRQIYGIMSAYIQNQRDNK